MTIDQLMERSCDQHATTAALRFKREGIWHAVTYGELWQQAREFACGLQQLQLRPGDHVAIIGSSSPRWVASYLGVLHAGGICVPVDKELKAVELRHILADCIARFLVLDENCLDTILELVPDLPKLEQIILFNGPSKTLQATGSLGELVEACQELKERNSLPSEDVSRLESLTGKALALLGGLQPKGIAGEPSDIFSPGRKVMQKMLKSGRLTGFDQVRKTGSALPHHRSVNETAVILYTSGTTGKSKGAMLSHANIVSNIRGAIDHLELKDDISTLSFLPINHVFEQVCGILVPLALGGTVSFAESIKKLGENLAEVRPTFLLGVPAVYRLLLDRITKNIQGKPLSRVLFNSTLTRPIVLSKIRKTIGSNTKFISGGAALDPYIAIGFRNLGLNLFQGYGITETAPVIAAESPDSRRPGSVGRPLKGVEVRIDNPQNDGIGEIVVRGPNVMQGYFNNPGATAEVLEGGWYHTGDLGYIDPDGYLFISGRAKNLIVTPNGKNVYPEEVENELLKSPYIAEAMVYGHKLSRTAEEVYAVIYPDQDQLLAYQEDQKENLTETDIEELIRREVREACRQLADYKRVKKISLRDEEFPKTTTRKIKRYVMDPDISTEG